MNPGREPVVDAVSYSRAAAIQRRRRLARVRLADLVPMRRAARDADTAQQDPAHMGRRHHPSRDRVVTGHAVHLGESRLRAVDSADDRVPVSRRSSRTGASPRSRTRRTAIRSPKRSTVAASSHLNCAPTGSHAGASASRSRQHARSPALDHIPKAAEPHRTSWADPSARPGGGLSRSARCSGADFVTARVADRHHQSCPELFAQRP